MTPRKEQDSEASKMVDSQVHSNNERISRKTHSYCQTSENHNSLNDDNKKVQIHNIKTNSNDTVDVPTTLLSPNSSPFKESKDLYRVKSQKMSSD